MCMYVCRCVCVCVIKRAMYYLKSRSFLFSHNQSFPRVGFKHTHFFEFSILTTELCLSGSWRMVEMNWQRSQVWNVDWFRQEERERERERERELNDMQMCL